MTLIQLRTINITCTALAIVGNLSAIAGMWTLLGIGAALVTLAVLAFSWFLLLAAVIGRAEVTRDKGSAE